MIELRDPGQMLQWSQARREEGQRVGLVPTMGYLHEGHLRLVDRAREVADATVVSAFVNPLQFGPSEDFDRYPRDPGRDRALAASRGAQCLFVPNQDAMYPREPVVGIQPGTLADHLCGRFRPGHFAGVLTVVAKLFHIIEPLVAVFGRKDAQQALMIRRMVQDLDFPVAIDVVPIVREADGLAMSSRNANLSASERAAAPAIAKALDAAHERFRAGETDAARVRAAAESALAAEPGLRVEYVELVDADTLEAATHADATMLLAVAVYAGSTRLIDNIILGVGTAADPRVPT